MAPEQPARCLREMELLPGVTLSVLDFCPESDIEVTTDGRGDKLEFAFVHSGEAETAVHAPSCVRVLEAAPKSAVSFYMPGSRTVFSLCKKQSVKMFGISLEADHLKALAGIDPQTGLGALLPLNEPVPLSPVAEVLVAQMFASRKRGAALTLFRQAKALELLSEMIDPLACGCRPPSRGVKETALRPADARRIRQAREILAANMAAPPSLPELSALVGLNRNKLKAGFHSLYSKPPYQCLHEDRMRRAEQLLSAGRMNVSQVARDVGYANVGHFSQAFFRYFGVQPKKFQLSAAG